MADLQTQLVVAPDASSALATLQRGSAMCAEMTQFSQRYAHEGLEPVAALGLPETVAEPCDAWRQVYQALTSASAACDALVARRQETQAAIETVRQEYSGAKEKAVFTGFMLGATVLLALWFVLAFLFG